MNIFPVTNFDNLNIVFVYFILQSPTLNLRRPKNECFNGFPNLIGSTYYHCLLNIWELNLNKAKFTMEIF